MFGKPNAKTQLLRGVPLFAGCTDAELARIASLVDEVEIPADRTLITEGASGHECFVVAEGTATASLRGDPIATYGPGAIFGEMALLDQGPRAATVVSDTPMRLLVLDRRRFASLLSNSSAVANKVLKVLVERLRQAEQAPVWT